MGEYVTLHIETTRFITCVVYTSGYDHIFTVNIDCTFFADSPRGKEFNQPHIIAVDDKLLKVTIGELDDVIRPASRLAPPS